MTASMKVKLLLAALFFANLAVWGAKQMLAGAFDPIMKALGS